MIVIAFALACIIVFGVAFVILARDVVIGLRLARRADAIVPRALLSQLRFAQIDAKRTAKAFKAIGELAPRAAVASASILASINTYRALLARLRDLA